MTSTAVGEPGDDAEVVGDEDEAAPVASCAVLNTSRIWAWIVTSSAVVGSSAMIRSGSLAMAMAIITRWRMPPENSCGNDRDPRRRVRDADEVEQLHGPRLRAADLPTSRCVGMASAIWSPIVYTGVSAESGSWKTIAITLPRILRPCRLSLRPSSCSPLNAPSR